MDALDEIRTPEVGPQPAPLQIQLAPTPGAAVIVAHPDDETLWAGGTILGRPMTQWFIASVCRQSDPERAPRFFRALQCYGATGGMADLDDGPQQLPLPEKEIQDTILQLLPALSYEYLLTHAPQGEYTRHLRHEEVSRAVLSLWLSGLIVAKEVWLFAYQDRGGRELPRAIENAHHYEVLPQGIWQQKYHLITEVYGFSPESWEARMVPRAEAFWRFESPQAFQAWSQQQGEEKA